MTLVVRVITPGGIIWDALAQEIVLPGAGGKLGILKNHAPILTFLEVGVMRIRTDTEWISIALMGGFAEVQGNEVTILVNAAERADQIDPQKAQTALEAAEASLTHAQSRREKIKAFQTLQRARARFQATV